jgi:hypothetical protein
MLDLPIDMLTLAAEIPPPEEWIIAKMIMPSGDVWLSDRPVNAILLALLPVDPLPIVEDWGTLADGGGLDKLLSIGSTGYLCCPKTRIVLIRADQTKTNVDAIISQGIHNRRIELYRWFSGMTSAPVLIDILFCQDRIELKETSMLFSFDAVGALASENPYMTDRAAGNKNWPYLIGKAQGVPLELLEDQSSKWTILLGDQDGTEIDESYIGLIRVQDATQLNAGQHLLNGEEVILAKASAGYMEITARARGGTEAQEHANGSRIFPLGAVFKYAVCAGPVGSLELLRTSNEIDFYDEDEDLDTAEYRDLYSGGNEVLRPELNPAQVWFTGRMPFLWKDQEVNLTDKLFLANSFDYSDYKDVTAPEGINLKDGKPIIMIDFQRFSDVSSDFWFKATDLCLPALPADTTNLGSSTYQSSVIDPTFFEISQSTGEYITNMSSTAYRRILIKEDCPDDEEIWLSMAPVLPPDGWFHYSEKVYYAITFQRAWTSNAGTRMRVVMVMPDGTESLLNITPSTVAALGNYGVLTFSGPKFDLYFPGSISGEKEWFPYGYAFSDAIDLGGANPSQVRFKMYIKMEQKGIDPSWGFFNIGSKSVYSDEFNYGMATFWQYYDNSPTAWISSTFDKDRSSSGVFKAARVKVAGKVKNSNDFAEGLITIYESDLIDNNINGAAYIAFDGEISFSTVPVLRDGELVAFINTGSEEWDRKNFTLTETITPGVYTVSPAPGSDFTFGSTSILIQGAWRSVDLSNGNKFSETIELSASTWAGLAATAITVKVALNYLLEVVGNSTEGKERIAGEASIVFDSGIEWLIDYTSTTLDGLQVNYTDQLYVDAISTRGTDWTPARAFKYLSDDKTSWAVDMLDNTDLDARHAEFVASGHYLNGLLVSERYQEAVKEVTRQGFSLPVQSAGKVSLNSYLSWPSVVSVAGDMDSILSSDRNYSQSNTPDLIQRLIIDYKKNFSTGIFNGQHELSTAEHVENMDIIPLDLVDADTAVQQAAAWLFALKSIQLESFGFDGNFRLLQAQLWDKVNLPDFLAGDLQEDMIAVSVGFQFAQPKNDKPSKLIIKAIKV